jgi:hypothetical protein
MLLKAVSLLFWTPALFTSSFGLRSSNAAPCTLAGLHWMTGTWRDEQATVVTEERWTTGPGGRLVGSSWTLHTNTTGGVIESMTIAQDSGGLAMRLRHFDATLAHAREDKDTPMLFVAVSCRDDFIRLDGTGAQSGEHFTYSRAGDHLKFLGEFIHSGQPVRAEVTFTRQDRP